MSLPHDSAHTHVTGQSVFIDDRPEVSGEVHVGVVYCPFARARIKKIHKEKGRALAGVVAVYTAEDIPHNAWGTIFQDQPLLADGEARFAGEAVAIVACETRPALKAALQAFRVDYEKLPAIRSVKEAREQKSFIGAERKIERGDVDGAFREAPHVLDGKIVIRGAEHFYLESNVCIAYPREGGQVEIHSSSQHPSEVQHVVAHALEIPFKDVVCIVTRMGGGFGGKESQGAPFAAYAALVATRLNRPARLLLTKDEDMIMTGKRNPFENEYRVAFDNEGRLLALEVNFFSDGGAYADLSTAIMERAMLHCDNAYYLPAVRVRGQVCRTNYHPHTAFRGFGGPKGVATIEKIIEQVAHYLNKDALTIRRLNVYQDKGGRNLTPYGQVVENNCLPELFDKLEQRCDYAARRREISAANQKTLDEGGTTLRGLSLTAVKFGISFTTRFLNQGNALINIYRDGSVQISTGATEMGQGVNSRIAQVVADELGLPRAQVRVMPTSTEKNANTSPTAASSGTDLNGAAAALAVRRIKSRLSEVALQLLDLPLELWATKTAPLGTQAEIQITPSAPTNDPNEGADWLTGRATFFGIEFSDGFVFSTKRPQQKIAFSDLVNEAYLNRVSLSDYAHYRIPGLSFNKLTGQGNAFLYFTQGVAASEVALDLTTGETKVTRADILMDLGRPINRDLDLGQVTGAFIQGMGWVTTENLFYSTDGLLISHSPSTYKIPSVQDVPRVFNFALLPNDNNKKSFKGMKAVGEPPLLLGLSVWTAIQDALKCLPQYGMKYPHVELPATAEGILRAAYPEKFERWE